jgi:hypothetical protein
MDAKRARVLGLVLAGVVVISLLVAAVNFFGFERKGISLSQDAPGPDSPYVIRSFPSGAEVYVNNVYAGLTPLAYESFDPGVLRMRLEQAGLAPVETVLIVSADGPAPNFPPFVFRIPVDLASVPPGANVIVDGRALRAYEAASLTLPANDTVSVAFDLEGEATGAVHINPIEGIIEAPDTSRWAWHPFHSGEPAQLVGIFAATVRVTSDPAGADIYLDNGPAPIGQTDSRVIVPYGTHTLTLRLPPFNDQVFTVESGHTKLAPLAAVLEKSVWVTAVDAGNPYTDVNALVAWVKDGDTYVVNPDVRLATPSTVLLKGRPCEVRLTCPGFADTTVVLAASASELIVEMRPLPKPKLREEEKEEEGFAWVRFVVKAGRKDGLEGAEVFGIEKTDGRVVRYGPTGADGEFTTRVPVGDYDWWAAKEGFTGRRNGERIKSGRKTKEITLKVKPE